MVIPRCDGCRCWLADDEERRLGECHKNAPRPVLAMRTSRSDMEHDAALEVDWPVTYASQRCDEFQPPPVQQTNELAILQVQLARVAQENVDLRRTLQEAEATLRDLRRVIVETEVSEGDGQ
jgi:hypothetical protein